MPDTTTAAADAALAAAHEAFQDAPEKPGTERPVKRVYEVQSFFIEQSDHSWQMRTMFRDYNADGTPMGDFQRRTFRGKDAAALKSAMNEIDSGISEARYKDSELPVELDSYGRVDNKQIPHLWIITYLEQCKALKDAASDPAAAPLNDAAKDNLTAAFNALAD